MINERLMLPGAWQLNLSPDTPQSILDTLDLADAAFGHVIVTPTHMHVPEVSGDTLLSVARYTGIYRSRPSKYELGGAGLPAWLGDEDGKGNPIQWGLAKTSGTFSAWVNDILPASITAGTITAIAGALTQTFRFISRRDALDRVCDYFGGEWRVNPDGTLDAGTESDLFVTSPVVVVQRWSGGRDLNVTGVYGTVDVSGDVEDYTTRVILIGEKRVGFANISPAATWLDLNGNVVNLTRIIESTETAPGNEDTVAQAQLNRFTKPRSAIMLTSDQYDLGADFGVGDTINVWDPEQGLVDLTNPVQYRGQTIYPVQIRVLGYDWPILPGMGVYFRAPDADGTLTDLTDYIAWDTGGTSIEIGATARRAVEEGVSSVSSADQPRSRVVATRTTTQSIPNVTWTTVAVTEVTDDTDDFSGNTFTSPVADFYNLGSEVTFAQDATGHRQVRFLINGTTTVGFVTQNATANAPTAITSTLREYELAAGDTVVLQVRHNQGAALNLDAASFPARFTVRQSR